MTSTTVEQSATRRLAVIVVIFNMRREAPRTLYSLSADYQLDVSSQDYDVIVVENGSTQPLSRDEVEQFGPNFQYLPIENASPSPAAAINAGAAQTDAHFVGIMIDGARMASPGLISLALTALAAYERPVVGTIAFHLGFDIQPRSILHGYDSDVEDKLLAKIDWRRNGYRLFEISTLAGSSSPGRLGKIANCLGTPSRFRSRGFLGRLAELLRAVAGLAESNLIFLPKSLFDELGGFDERFDLPGGGIVNLDFYRRACDLRNTTLIALAGEATFHQIHGGTMTNRPMDDVVKEIAVYHAQFLKIQGKPFEHSARVAMVIGLPPRQNICDHMRASQLQCHVDPTSLKIRVVLFIIFGWKRWKGLLKKAS